MPDTLPISPDIASADPPQGRHHQPGAGLTVENLARRYRVSPDKIRGWIARGELRAINTAIAVCGKPRWVITPDALAAFEQKRLGGPTPKPQRRRRTPSVIDFYSD